MRAFLKNKKLVLLALVTVGLTSLGAASNHYQNATTLTGGKDDFAPKTAIEGINTEKDNNKDSKANSSTSTNKVPISSNTNPETSSNYQKTSPAPKNPPAPEPGSNTLCDPNYTGCVPNVWPKDVDCTNSANKGDGPYYTPGPIKVIGIDIYHLDSDKDKIACETHSKMFNIFIRHNSHKT